MVFRGGLAVVRTSEEKIRIKKANKSCRHIWVRTFLAKRIASTKAVMQECDVPGVLVAFKV